MLKTLPDLWRKNTGWLETQQTSILSAAFIITAANIASSLSGLLRQRLLISVFFNSQESQQAFEALLVAFQIPDMLFQLIILGSLSAAFIPVFASMKKKDEPAAFKMSAVVINVMLLLFIGLAALIFFFAEPLTAWRTGDAFTPEQIAIATNLTRVMLIAQVFFAISSFFSAILQSYQRFIIPSLAPVLYNLGILAGVYLFSEWLGIYSAGVGVALGAFLHMIIQAPLAFKLGFRFRPSLNLRVAGLRELSGMMPARVLTIGIAELQKLSLGFFATSLGNLSFVIIQLANNLITIPIRLFGVPISQASLPFLADQSGEDNRAHFRELVLQGLNQIAFFALPASILLLILRIPIVRLVFGTHNFPWTATLMTGRAVALIAVSIAAQAMVQLLIRAFHALKDTYSPLIISVVQMLLYLGGSAVVVFATDWGILGIAAVTALTAILELIAFVLLLQRKIGGIMTPVLWVPQLKMILASFLMAVFLYLPFRILDELVFNTSRTIELISLTVTTATIGMLVYIYFAALLDVRELRLVSQMLHSLGLWRKSLPKTSEVLVDTTIDDDNF